MMLKINKCFRNCSAVTHIWRTMVGGSLFSSLQTPENVYEVSYHKTILKKKKKNPTQENLSFLFYSLDLHMRLFQPTLLSLLTSDLQFRLTSNQVYLSCPIGKSKAVCSKWNWFSFPHLFFNSFLPLGMSLTFHSILKLLHLMGFSPFPLHVTVLTVDLLFSFPVVSIHRKPSPLTQVPAVRILGLSSPVHFLHCPQFDISKKYQPDYIYNHSVATICS